MPHIFTIYVLEGDEPINSRALAEADVVIRMDGGQRDFDKVAAWKGEIVKMRSSLKFDEGQPMKLLRNL